MGKSRAVSGVSHRRCGGEGGEVPLVFVRVRCQHVNNVIRFSVPSGPVVRPLEYLVY